MEKKRLKLFVLIFFLLIFVILAEGFLYWRMTSKPPLAPSPGEYVTLERVDGYSSPGEPIEGTSIYPGKYFVILEQKRDWLHIKMARTKGEGWEGWIKAEPSTYRLVE